MSANKKRCPKDGMTSLDTVGLKGCVIALHAETTAASAAAESAWRWAHRTVASTSPLTVATAFVSSALATESVETVVDVKHDVRVDAVVLHIAT